MTSRSTWKAAERRAARFFGVERTPLSGSGSRHTMSDTLHPRLYIEVKYRAHWAVFALFREVELAARKEGKIPALWLKEKNKPGDLVVVRAEHIEKLVEERMNHEGLRARRAGG